MHVYPRFKLSKNYVVFTNPLLTHFLGKPPDSIECGSPQYVPVGSVCMMLLYHGHSSVCSASGSRLLSAMKGKIHTSGAKVFLIHTEFHFLFSLGVSGWFVGSV